MDVIVMKWGTMGNGGTHWEMVGHTVKGWDTDMSLFCVSLVLLH